MFIASPLSGPSLAGDSSFLKLPALPTTTSSRGYVTRHELSEIVIHSTAVALARKYNETRQCLADRKIDHKSAEGVESLRLATAQIEVEIPVPRSGMKMDLVRWYKMRLRRIYYQRVQQESIQRGELGSHMPYISDELHLGMERRRSALAKTLTSERMRSCKYLVHAIGIKNVAESIGLHGVFVTVTSLEGDEFFTARWQALRDRFGEMLGFWVREPHKNGLPHWHLLLYVEPERMERLQKLLAKMFGLGPSLCVKRVIPGYSTIIQYMLKCYDMRPSCVTNASDLTRRASSHRAISGRRGIGFLDCASSTRWDQMRRIKDDSAALSELTTAEMALRAAAIRNDYETFIGLSARELVKMDSSASTLTKRIATSDQSSLCTDDERKAVAIREMPGHKRKRKPTVAHSSKSIDMEPRAVQGNAPTPPSSTYDAPGKNESGDKDQFGVITDEELLNAQEAEGDVSALVPVDPVDERSEVIDAGLTIAPLRAGDKPVGTSKNEPQGFVKRLWRILIKTVVKMVSFFAKNRSEAESARRQGVNMCPPSHACKGAGLGKLDRGRP